MGVCTAVTSPKRPGTVRPPPLFLQMLGKRLAASQVFSVPPVPVPWAVLQGCTSVMFFEARKHKDLYLWLAKAPNGPCAKFHITNSE